MAEWNRVPPFAAGTLRHVQGREALEGQERLLDRSDREQVVFGNGFGKDLGHRFVEARQEGSLATVHCAFSPSGRKACLAATGRSGNDHTPVEVQRGERPRLVGCDPVERHPGLSGLGLRIPSKIQGRPQEGNDGFDLVCGEGTIMGACLHQFPEAILHTALRISEVAGEEELRCDDPRW